MITTSTELLGQLSLLLEQMTDEDYARRLEIMNGASIGQHVRHTLEFFICLLEQKPSGLINYDLRRRDPDLESHVDKARKMISVLIGEMSNQMDDQPLLLSFRSEVTDITVPTNYFRELIYVIEHTVHHMALIRIGLKDLNLQLAVPETFGVAASTLRYRKSPVSER